jgi:hypothetical protein
MSPAKAGDRVEGSIPRISALTAAVALLTGCAMLSFEPARLGLRLPPAALGASISLHQQLTVERSGRADALEVALEVDPQQLNLIGLAFGQRVLTLHYDGRMLTSWRHSLLPDELRAEDVLEDVQLTLWPADAIRQALPAGWRLEENGLRRTLFTGEMPVTAIEYSGEPRWSGKIELYNLRYHYRLVIQSVSNDP